MGYEQEAFRKLMSNIWGNKSRMQEEMSKGAKGEPFIVQELSRKGPQTPTQLAAAMRATTGRVSTLLSALEKKGQITREIDPNDRRIVPKSSVRTCGRRSAGSFRRWVNGAPVSSWTSPSNLPPTCPCACRASHVPLRSRSGRPSARQVAPTAQQADGVRGPSRRGQSVTISWRVAFCSSNRIQSALRPRAAVCAHRSRMRRNQQRQTMQSQIALREYTETGVISYTVNN